MNKAFNLPNENGNNELILRLLGNNQINNENFINNNRKKIEVIYSHKQGLKSLTKSFGVSHIF